MSQDQNKYHFAREVIFNLKSCQAISEKVYLHWIDKLIKDEKDNAIIIWYSESEMHDWLIKNKYSKEIASELSKPFADSLQYAFEKGAAKMGKEFVEWVNLQDIFMNNVGVWFKNNPAFQEKHFAKNTTELYVLFKLNNNQ